MDFKLTAKNFRLTESLRNVAQEHADRLDRFSHNIIELSLVFEKEKSLDFVELTATIKKGFLRADVRTSDMYQGISEVFNKVEKQLKKHEEKLRERKRLASKHMGRL